MTQKEIETYALQLSNTYIDYPFGDDVTVYKVGDENEPSKGKMFALVARDAHPARVSLKCQPELADALREKYETVMPGYHLNKKHWNTIVCSGQLSDDEIRDLIFLSYQLVTGAQK